MLVTARLVAAYRALTNGGPPTQAPPVHGVIAFADPRRLFPGGYSTPYNPSALHLLTRVLPRGNNV